MEVKLGWLIDRKNRRVEIYRQGKEVEVLDAPTNLSGEDLLPGFVLDMGFIVEILMLNYPRFNRNSNKN